MFFIKNTLFLLSAFCSLICLHVQAAGYCPALPVPSGTIITVSPSQAAQLPGIVAGAAAGTTILLKDGTYTGFELAFNTPRVTLRSESGNRDTVIIDGNYTAQETIRIYASSITIADLTVKRALFHPIHAGGNGHYAMLYNLHIIDGGAQFVKVNSDGLGHYNDFGTLACSLVEMTPAGRAFVDGNGSNCYTGGLDAHEAWGWTVRDNTLKDIWCAAGGLAEHAIHFWDSSRDPVIERNVVINNARGIGLGLGNTAGKRTYSDLTGVPANVQTIGGVIRNNFVLGNVTAVDTNIGLEQAWNAKVFHNTIYATHGLGLDIRFVNSNPVVQNNLMSPAMDLRDGGTTSANSGNVTAAAGMFVNPGTGDLHLVVGAAAAINKGVSLGGAVPADIDGQNRDAQPDAGADEYSTGGASTPCDVNNDGNSNVADVQLCVNQAISAVPCVPNGPADINKDGICNVIDVQRVVNAALGGACVTQ